MENESRRIGNVHLPEPFYKRMIACPALEMLRSTDDRVEHLVGMYGSYDGALLRKGFNAIRSELAGRRQTRRWWPWTMVIWPRRADSIGVLRPHL